MPHYKDGRKAEIGDRVVGKGYNIAVPISGVVVGIVEDSESCNLRVAHARLAKMFKTTDAYGANKPTAYIIESNATVIDSVPLVFEIEYGDTKGFDKL